MQKKLFQMSQCIIEKMSMRLWSMSSGRNEFEQYQTLPDGLLKHTLTAAALGRGIAAEGSRLGTWSPPRSGRAAKFSSQKLAKPLSSFAPLECFAKGGTGGYKV
jgi:hypothetical protein